MSLSRRLLRSDAMQSFFSGLAASYIRFVYWTNRWERVGYDIADRLLAQNARAIICFWHGRLLMMPYAVHGNRPFHIMISDHRDGRLIARTVRRFGIDVIPGSSSRGPVLAAEMAEAVLLPLGFATSRRSLAKSWDRFLLPLPFGRGVFVMGPEIPVPAGLDAAGREQLRLRLEQALNEVTAEADRRMGHAPVAPAAAQPSTTTREAAA